MWPVAILNTYTYSSSHTFILYIRHHTHYTLTLSYTYTDNNEMESLHERHTYELIEFPKGKKLKPRKGKNPPNARPTL